MTPHRYRCDFNTGTCRCPASRLWDDCSLVADEMADGDTLSGSLEVFPSHDVP